VDIHYFIVPSFPPRTLYTDCHPLTEKKSKNGKQKGVLREEREDDCSDNNSLMTVFSFIMMNFVFKREKIHKAHAGGHCAHLSISRFSDLFTKFSRRNIDADT
jgi:hypothetical protein